MMSAKYKIKIPTDGSSATTINIPVVMQPSLTDQAEIVNRKFVDIEVEDAVNPILDYEKVRFTPIYFSGGQKLVDKIIYDVRFLSASNFPSGNSTYADIGISDDDIKFGKKRFFNSFLNLSFYDSDRATSQRLMSFINIFPKITSDNIQSSGDPTPGLPKPANQIPVVFELEDPIRFPNGFAEGFFVYHFKDEVSQSLPKELYMRARFNNAANGKTTNMMTGSVALPIEDLVNNIYTKYILRRDNSGFYYEIDETYSNNVSRNSDTLTIKLYEIQAT